MAKRSKRSPNSRKVDPKVVELARDMLDPVRMARQAVDSIAPGQRADLRRAFAAVRAHKMTPEGRVAMRIVEFLRAIAHNAKKAEEQGEGWTSDTPSEWLEDIASRIDEGQGWT